jgi:hypothetical protein
MKKIIFPVVLLLILSADISAQSIALNKTNQLADITGTIGSSEASLAASYVYNWQLGKKKKWEMGLGARWTSYTGNQKDFITAGPARFTRSFTVPFIIFFAGQKEENFDTLTLRHSFVNAVNFTANFGYHFNNHWSGGFNIDLIGITFGKKQTGSLKSNGVISNDPSTRPTSFNVLLTGDHDRGSLNSEFFLRYKLNDRWAIKALYQFLFVEYKTETVHQYITGGPENNRFRNKANNFGIGVSYYLKKS